MNRQMTGQQAYCHFMYAGKQYTVRTVFGSKLQKGSDEKHPGKMDMIMHVCIARTGLWGHTRKPKELEAVE